MPSLIKEKRRRRIGAMRKTSVLQMSINDILNTVCLIQGVSRLDARSKSRGAELVKARAIFAYISRKRGLSTIAIGEAINRNHASICHHYNKYSELLDKTKPWYDAELDNEVQKISMIINS